MSSKPPAVPAGARDELQRLSTVAQALATRLGIAAQALKPEAPAPGMAGSGLSDPNDLAKAARRYLRARRRREAAFGADLFADPCWDMMLDLFASMVEGKQVSVSSACIAANVPSTTALRWLTRMEELGLVVRTADRRDARRAFLTLSEHAYRGVGDWIDSAFAEANAERPGEV